MTVRRSESGVALISVILLLMLASAMLAGVASLTMTDAKLRAGDRVQTQAFYAASGALEKLTADMGNLFLANVAPTSAQIHALELLAPTIPGIRFQDSLGASGYTTVFPEAAGRPVTVADNIDAGPFEGMIGLLTQYTLGITAQVLAGTDVAGEVSLQRRMQTVAVPVFQFGVFAQGNLAFHAGSIFNFGGRVHTNGNLFLAASDGFSLTMANKVTAVGEVIRTNIENGWPTATGGYNGTVSVLRAPGVFRNLAANEGSVVGNTGTATNEPTWTNLSIGTYNGNIRNTRTGARALTLPFVSLGALPVDLIRRGVGGATPDNPLVLAQRYYSLASLRILLSDTAAEITGLPGITAGAPVHLDTRAAMTALVPAYTAPDRLAASNYDVLVGGRRVYRSQNGTPLLDGWIKIEMQRANLTWQDVTMEILNLGITGLNPLLNAMGNPTCVVEPDANAILRLQRVRNVPVNNGACGVAAGVLTTSSFDFWPNVLYDAREGRRREGVAMDNTTNLFLGGVMGYIELDVRNLSRWFQGALPAAACPPVVGCSGAAALSTTGYTVYFSDRRGNKTGPIGEPALAPRLPIGANSETGRYGAEDFVNPASAVGAASLGLETGEDVNGNGVLDVYGETPSVDGVWNSNLPGAKIPLTNASRPWTDIANTVDGAEPVAQRPFGADLAQANRPILFRRALKLKNGGLGNIVAPGLTIVAENAVYVQGDWNANAAGFGAGSMATAVIADSVTLLSNSWNDIRSFTLPNNPTNRPATQTWYRMAVLAGNPIAFPFGGGVEESFGADGGVHNFLRMLEGWAGININYNGSIASFYVNQQATGIFKCCNNVYGLPANRNFTFDINFLNPALLPPLTPMFRDINATFFTQVIE